MDLVVQTGPQNGKQKTTSERTTMRTRLEKIEALTDEQREQLADWLHMHSLDKAVELVKEEFGVEIARSTLNRFRKRCELREYLDASEESARARAELVSAAASGKPNFCQATIDLLEKQIFADALVRNLDLKTGLRLKERERPRPRRRKRWYESIIR